MIASVKLLVTALAIIAANLDGRHHVTGSREKRDDSGLMTVDDLLDKSHSMCEQLGTLNSMLESPLTMGMGNAILNQPMPVPNPAVLDVFGIVGMLLQQFNKIEDMINANANGGGGTPAATDIPTTTAVTLDLQVERSNFMMTPRDLIAMGTFLCKLLETTRNVMTSPAVSWMGLGGHRLPLPDGAHPLDFVKILDPLGLFQIPGNILQMFGMVAPPTTTTTTQDPWSMFG